MKVAGVQRSSTVAWGASLEHSSLLAAGTVAGAISDSFDSSAHLEVFKLDSQAGELGLPQVVPRGTHVCYCVTC